MMLKTCICVKINFFFPSTASTGFIQTDPMNQKEVKFGFFLIKKDAVTRKTSSLRLEDLNGYIDISISYIIQNRLDPTEDYERITSVLKFEVCDKKQLSDIGLDKGVNSKFYQKNTIYCPVKSEYYSVFGKFEEVIFLYVKINVARCSNSQDPNKVCQSDKEINEFIQGIDFDIILGEHQVNEKMETFDGNQKQIEDLVPFPRLTFWTLDQKVLYLNNIEINKLTMKRKIQRIFQFNQNDAEISLFNTGFQMKLEDKKVAGASATDFASFYIRASNDQITYSVLISTVASEIIESLALAGGLLSSFLGIGTLLYKHYQQYKVVLDLMNNVFVFVKLNQGMGTQQSSEKSGMAGGTQMQLKMKNLDQYVDMNYFLYLGYLVLEGIYGAINLFRKQPLEIKNQIFRIMAQSMTQIKNDLDLRHLLSRLYDIDQLQLLLMDEPQIILFNSIAKPTVYIDDKNAADQQKEEKKAPVRKTEEILPDDNEEDQEVLNEKLNNFFQSHMKTNNWNEISTNYNLVCKQTNSKNMLNEGILELIKGNQPIYRILEKRKENLLNQDPEKNQINVDQVQLEMKNMVPEEQQILVETNRVNESDAIIIKNVPLESKTNERGNLQNQ